VTTQALFACTKHEQVDVVACSLVTLLLIRSVVLNCQSFLVVDLLSTVLCASTNCTALYQHLGDSWLNRDSIELARIFKTAILSVGGVVQRNSQANSTIYTDVIFAKVSLSEWRILTALTGDTTDGKLQCSYRIVTSVTNNNDLQSVGGIPDGENLALVRWNADGSLESYSKSYVDLVQVYLNTWVSQGKRSEDAMRVGLGCWIIA
jgi:hypothetical protein